MADAKATRIALAGLVALAVATGVGRFAFTPLLPMMHADFGVSNLEGSFLAAANYLGYFVGAGFATLRPPRATWAMRAGLLTIALATLAMGATSAMAIWLGLRTLAGIATAYVFIATTVWSLGALPPQRTFYAGLVFSGVGIGIAVAGALALVFATVGISSNIAWVVLGGAALFASAYPGALIDDATPIVGRRVEAALSWPRRWTVLALSYGAFGFAYIIPATFLPTMARAVISDPAAFGWAWPIFGIAAALSTLLAVPMMRAYGDRTVWIASYAVMAGGVVAPTLWPGLVPILIAALCVGGTFMVSTLAGLREARRVASAEATRLIAAMTAGFALGQIVGSLVGGLVVTATGSFSPALLSATALLTLAIVALLADTRAAYGQNGEEAYA